MIEALANTLTIILFILWWLSAFLLGWGLAGLRYKRKSEDSRT